MTTSFRVWLVNFQYFLGTHFDSFDSALDAAKSTGYECNIVDGQTGVVIGHWSYLSGFTKLDQS